MPRIIRPNCTNIESEPILQANSQIAYWRGIQALRFDRRLTEADAVGSVALERFPGELRVALEYC